MVRDIHYFAYGSLRQGLSNDADVRRAAEIVSRDPGHPGARDTVDPLRAV